MTEVLTTCTRCDDEIQLLAAVRFVTPWER